MSGTATSSTTATLVGRTSDANATQATFVLVGGAGNAPADLSASAPDRTFESAATGLTPGANYTFKVEFRDGGGTLIATSTNSCPFTPPVPPTYVCVSGTATSSTTATLVGRTTDTNATQATFVLSPAQGTAPDDTTAAGPDATFESSATGLTPNRNYTFQVQFRNTAGTVLGTSANSCPFTTPTAPTYVCINAASITQTSAMFGGSTSNQNVKQARFTLTPAVGAPLFNTLPMPVGGDLQFFVTANGLTPGANYTFLVEFLDQNNNVVGSNVAGNRCPFPTLHRTSASTPRRSDRTQPPSAAGPTNPAASQARFTLTPPVGLPVVDTSSAPDNGAFKFEVTLQQPDSRRRPTPSGSSSSTPVTTCSARAWPMAVRSRRSHRSTSASQPATNRTETSAVIGGSTNNELVTEARFFVSPAGGNAPADTTFARNVNGNRDFSTTATGLTPGTGYTFVVQFLDNAGNILGSSVANGCPFNTLNRRRVRLPGGDERGSDHGDAQRPDDGCQRRRRRRSC